MPSKLVGFKLPNRVGQVEPDADPSRSVLALCAPTDSRPADGYFGSMPRVTQAVVIIHRDSFGQMAHCLGINVDPDSVRAMRVIGLGHQDCIDETHFVMRRKQSLECVHMVGLANDGNREVIWPGKMNGWLLAIRAPSLHRYPLAA